MRVRIRNSVSLITALIIFLCTFVTGARTVWAGLPQMGDTIPSFRLPSPAAESDLAYLGLKGQDFSLKDIECRLLIIEIIGVYCPYCYEQAPIFNKLHARLSKKNLADKVKMLAIAAGGTASEIEYLVKHGSYEFPIVRDETYAVHKLLGEPRTPFTILMTREGKVLHTHQSVMEDTDSFLNMIEDFLKQ